MIEDRSRSACRRIDDIDDDLRLDRLRLVSFMIGLEESVDVFSDDRYDLKPDHHLSIVRPVRPAFNVFGRQSLRLGRVLRPPVIVPECRETHLIPL